MTQRHGSGKKPGMSAPTVPFHDLSEFAIDFLLTGRGDGRALAFALVQGWPQFPALDVIFAMSLAAGGIEQTLAGEESVAQAMNTWRMAALVGVDLSMMRKLGLPTDTSADLMAYWQAHDQFFLPI